MSNLNSTVLVADNDLGAQRLFRIALLKQFNVHTVVPNGDQTTLEMFAALAQTVLPDLIILDPQTTGLSVQAVRKELKTPLMVVSGLCADTNIRLSYLNDGADDSQTKPFGGDELAARIRAVLRPYARRTSELRDVIEIGDVCIDLNSRLITKSGKSITLTRTEFNLLEMMVGKVNCLLSYGQILAHVWGPEYVNDSSNLQNWVYRLRGKLEDDPRHPRLIKTFQGIGYMLCQLGVEPELTDQFSTVDKTIELPHEIQERTPALV